MRNFQVLPIAHSLKNNKVAESGDIVSESQLTSPADELVLAGFLKEVFDAEEVADKIEEIEVESEEVAEEVVPKKVKK